MKYKTHKLIVAFRRRRKEYAAEGRRPDPKRSYGNAKQRMGKHGKQSFRDTMKILYG